LNKCDEIADRSFLPSDCICISAKENIGIDYLKERIVASFSDRFVTLKLYIPYESFGDYAELKGFVNENTRQYTDNGMEINCVIDSVYSNKFKKFII
jgi:50S ribosomal subunit-associated GTPase HflX